MKISKTLIVGALLSLAAPAAALSGEVVTFSFKKSELETQASRQSLLDRIELHSFRSCDTGSALASEKTIKRCAVDLRDQFIKAIDDEALNQLAQSQSDKPFRTARR